MVWSYGRNMDAFFLFIPGCDLSRCQVLDRLCTQRSFAKKNKALFKWKKHKEKKHKTPHSSATPAKVLNDLSHLGSSTCLRGRHHHKNQLQKLKQLIFKLVTNKTNTQHSYPTLHVSTLNTNVQVKEPCLEHETDYYSPPRLRLLGSKKNNSRA